MNGLYFRGCWSWFSKVSFGVGPSLSPSLVLGDRKYGNEQIVQYNNKKPEIHNQPINL